MKKILLPTVCVLVLTLILAVFPTEAEGAIYDDTIRLHILANSDSDEDQALKIAVRDAVLLKHGEELGSCRTKCEAAKKVSELLPKIRKTAEETVRKNGYTYTVNIRMGEEYYPTRRYEGFTLPAGTYLSLIIELGDADGQNWWCVMYPPLCVGASVEDAAVSYSGEELRLIRGEGVRVKFKALELFSRYLG